MQAEWIEHSGLPIIIDPKDGYEAIRGCRRSLIVMYPDRRQPLLVKVRQDRAGRTVGPANSRLMLTGIVYDYYIAYV